MHLFRPSLSLTHSVLEPVAYPADYVNFQIEVQNIGVYPSHVQLRHELPPGLQFITATTSVSGDLTFDGNQVLFDVQFGDGESNKGLPRNEAATFMVTAQVEADADLGVKTTIATIEGTGQEASPGDESASVELWLLKKSGWLPMVIR